jgi:uncharacterized protein
VPGARRAEQACADHIPTLLDQLTAENMARQLVRNHAIRALDALHLAVAELSARPLADDDEDVDFASRDSTQLAAAVSLGFVAV